MSDLTLHATHAEYAVSAYPEMTQLEFIGMVCNNVMALPQAKLAPVLHVPMLYWQRDGQGECRLYAGHPVDNSTIDYMIVLPDVEPMDILSDGGVTFSVLNRSNRLVLDRLQRAGITLDRCAVTRAIRFVHPAGNKPAPAHKSSCATYVQADIHACKPKVIIAMGAQALKALYGQKAKMSSVRGNVVYYGDAMVIPTDTPKSFLSGYAGLPVFISELKRARAVCEGTADLSLPSSDGYRVCYTRGEVEQLVRDIRASGSREIAIDCEWGNDVAREEYSYTLSTQLCWAAGQSAFVALRGEGGAEIHGEDDLCAIFNMLGDLLGDPDIQLIGHHLRVDVQQFFKNGVNIDEKVATGFCTMLVHHLLYSDDMQGLDNLCRKYTPQFGAFWQELEDWLDGTGERGKHLQYGYRDIPYEILIPYAQRDADVTWRCAQQLRVELSEHPRLQALYWNTVAPCALHLMDMERQGLLIDVKRRRELLEFYQPVRDYYAQLIREAFNWPDMNPGSPDQLKTALFHGCTYSNAKKLPEGVNTLQLKPLFNTHKYPKAWGEIEANMTALYNSPSTNNASLELLYLANPDLHVLIYLRHFSAVNKLISGYLADPELNEHQVKSDGRSLGCNIYEDGRARTNLSQITSTGRYTSSRANLQTWPKKQESALLAAVVFYQFGIDVPTYNARCKSGEIAEDQQIVLHSVKSCVMAAPGHKLIEVDFKTAELFVWAYASGDPALIHVIDSGRNLHSENAAKAFQLPELAQLEGVLAELEAGNPKPYNDWADHIAHTYSSLRIAAKNIIFGVMYGRGANALAWEIGKTGVEITADDCQRIIDTIAQAYPIAWGMLENNARLAIEQEWVENAFGRRRMFTGVQTASRSDQASAQRQAKNSPIQGCVGDLLAQAGVALYNFRYKTDIGKQLAFKLLLPIHDAFLVEVADDRVEKTVKVLDLCMGKLNKIPGTDYNLSVDVEIMDRWGEH